MKKILLPILAFVFFVWNIAWANNLPANVTSSMDDLVVSFEHYYKDLSTNQKIDKFDQLISLLEIMKSRISSSKIPVAEYLQEKLAERIEMRQVLWEMDEPVNQIANVNMDLVRETWLSWHNQDRANRWLAPYTWNNKLEYTASLWSNYLSKINTSTHIRNAWDGYYNYTSIKNRFANKWVVFNESKWTAFSENIAYQYYSCNKNDCTQDLIKQIRLWYDFFMWEASWNWPHFRAIVHPYFDEMGMWIGLVWKRYYIVTHYWYRPQ